MGIESVSSIGVGVLGAGSLLAGATIRLGVSVVVLLLAAGVVAWVSNSVRDARQGRISSIIALLCVLVPAFFALTFRGSGRADVTHRVSSDDTGAQVEMGVDAPSADRSPPHGLTPGWSRAFSVLWVGVFLYLVYVLMDGVIRGRVLRPSLFFTAAGFVGLCVAGVRFVLIH